MGTSIWWLLYNLYLTSMGFDVGFIGLTETLWLTACVVCSLPAGLISDRIGRKRALVIGLIGMVSCRCGIVAFSSGWLIIVSSILFGVFEAPFLVSGAPFLMENSIARDRMMLFTTSASLNGLASFVATTGGGYLPRLLGDILNTEAGSAPAYRAAMMMAVFASALALVPLFTLKEEKKAVSLQPTTGLARSIWPRLSNPKLMAKVLIPQVLLGFGSGLLFPFLNLFYKQRFGVSDGALGWIFGVMKIIVALMVLGGGALAEHHGKIGSLLVARTLGTPLLLVMGFVPSLPIAVAAHWLGRGLFRLGGPLYKAFAMEQFDEGERATGNSLLQMVWDFGGAVGPYTSGLMQVRIGLGPVFVATTILYALSLACVYRFFGFQKGVKHVVQS